MGRRHAWEANADRTELESLGGESHERNMLRSETEGEITKEPVRMSRVGAIYRTMAIGVVPQPAKAQGTGMALYILYPREVSRITPRTCSSTNPAFRSSATATRADEESSVCLDSTTNWLGSSS